MLMYCYVNVTTIRVMCVYQERHRPTPVQPEYTLYILLEGNRQTRASSECELQTRHSCKQSTFLKRHIQIKHKQSTSRHLHCCAIPQTLSKSIRMDLDRILWIVTLVAKRNCTVFLFLNSMSRRLQEHCWNQSSWTLEIIQSLFWFVA